MALPPEAWLKPQARRLTRPVLIGLVLGLLALTIAARTAHRRPPSPQGMVFRVEAREVANPMDRIEAYAVDRQGPAVAIYLPATYDHKATLRIHRYPDGKCIEEVSGPAAVVARAQIVPSAGVPALTFDFNSDGDTDVVEISSQIEADDYGTVQIRSGRGDCVLFEDRDPLEYEDANRAFPLGDLDADGFAELALVHPRMNRSRYDWEFGDLLFGSSCWVTPRGRAHCARGQPQADRRHGIGRAGIPPCTPRGRGPGHGLSADRPGHLRRADP